MRNNELSKFWLSQGRIFPRSTVPHPEKSANNSLLSPNGPHGWTDGHESDENAQKKMDSDNFGCLKAVFVSN